MEELEEQERKALRSLCSLSTIRLSPERRFTPIPILAQHAKSIPSLINVLKAANQPVPDELLKFGTTVKKKGHEAYGNFFKDVDTTKAATKIKFY